VCVYMLYIYKVIADLLKSAKDATLVHKKYIRDTPNWKKKKDQEKHENYKYLKSKAALQW
jgi:hypothetical protein